ncbi:MAG: CCA tRNA nucleotidyltransferase [Candidatus Omnitrophica bacterium]|nr:CCA tRNA nucleotidyltransferase [Candidatus Omnitrophota bacterium]
MDENQKQQNIKNIAASIVKKLVDTGYEAYFVGGCVRDMIMGRESEDIDIATSARPDDVEKLFKRTIPVGKQFGVILVVLEGIEFEVATFRSDGEYIDGRHPQEVHFSSAEEDAKRRDFTVNGLFFDPLKKKVIDFINGEADIGKKIIRAIGEAQKRFQEDKLRILRAVRFATKLEFAIEEKTFDAIRGFVSCIDEVSQERIRDELVKMLTGPQPARALELMDEAGILEKILPEVMAMKGVEQNPQFHPEGDVFIHTMLMMKQLKNPSLVLAFSALLHDIGKPKTFDPKTLKTTYHSDVGGRITEKILKRLRFSNEETEKIAWCVCNHMNFMHVQRMRIGKLKRMMSLDTFNDELALHRIDCLASHGMLDNYEFLIRKQEEFKEEDLKPKPLVNGHDLIGLGFEPGPLFKEILDEAWTLQLEHEITTRDEGIAWVKKQYEKDKR